MNQLKPATLLFIKLAVIWLLALFLTSVFELILNGVTHELPKEWPSVLLWSWMGDLIFWLKWLIIEYLIFLALYFASPKIATTVFSTFILISVLIQIVLIQYFNTSLVPLGSDIYGYSIADIKQTVGASGGINVAVIVAIFVLLGLLVAALRFLPRHLKMPLALAMFFILLSLGLNINGRSFVFTTPGFKSDFANNLALNKSDYFFSSSYGHFFPDNDDEVDIYADAYIGDYLTTSVKIEKFVYPDENKYPFFHKDNTTDVLGPFFNTGNLKPNIVVILVEGLGRAFTNEGAYLGNFTPFLDSLSSKSLYWENFLSQGGRTFAVLPSLMGSLPFGKNGFLELGNQMPQHLSLYSILKSNGYLTSFHYGGDASFDNMSLFLKRNAVDRIMDGKSFPAGYNKMPAINGFTWGYGDKELFRHYFATNNAGSNPKPQLDVLLTVSTHNPFLINEQDKYVARFEQRMDALGFDEPTKESYRNYKLQYSSILYADDALRSFFATYRQRTDYNNTIFIITGDHRMPEIPMRTKIDRYHVPLIIYSPLLKRTATFRSVSTHFDIAPSLLSFLNKNYSLPAPAYNTWIGSGLDTARNFRNIHAYPLIQTKTETIDFVMGEYHLNGNKLYKLSADMSEEPITDEAMLRQLKGSFDNFKQRNLKVSNKNAITPDSLNKRFNPIQ